MVQTKKRKEKKIEIKQGNRGRPVKEWRRKRKVQKGRDKKMRERERGNAAATHLHT